MLAPLEHLHSKHMLEGISLFTGASSFISQYSLHSHLLNGPATTRSALFHYRLAVLASDTISRLEYLARGTHVDLRACYLFQIPMENSCVLCFQNDEHFENLTRFMKSELFGLTERLGLEEKSCNQR